MLFSEKAQDLFEKSFLGSSSGLSSAILLKSSLSVMLDKLSHTARFLPIDWHPDENEVNACPYDLLSSMKQAVAYDARRVVEDVLIECERAAVFLALREVLFLLAGRRTPTLSERTTECMAYLSRKESGGRMNPVSVPLLTVQAIEELLSRWVISSMGTSNFASRSLHTDLRESVTSLDLGLIVARRDRDNRASPPPLYRIVELSRLCRGAYWAGIQPAQMSSPLSAPMGTAASGQSAEYASTAPERVDCEALQLVPPVSLHLDPLLPCDELRGPQASSKCVYLSFLKGIQSQPALLRSLETSAEEEASKRSKQVAQAVQYFRRTLSAKKALLLQHPADPQKSKLYGTVKDNDCLVLQLGKNANPSSLLRVEVLLRTVEKLALLWDHRRLQCTGYSTPNECGTTTACPKEAEKMLAEWRSSVTSSSLVPASHIFFLHVFRLLLRYKTFFGPKGYNQGPQAAVPAPVVESMQSAFSTEVEGFASPLNVFAGHYQFFSLFPDIDFPFGSLGSFFDARLLGGHYEVNPPFDTLVLRQMQKQLLHSLEQSDMQKENGRSLLFVVILPSHDCDEGELESVGDVKLVETHGKRDREGKVIPHETSGSTAEAPNIQSAPSVERTLRESPYCLSHVLCKASEAAYVDGHQHIIRLPLFQIQTATRLIVLGNAEARRRYGAEAAQRLESVRKTWKEWSSSVFQ